MLLQVSDDTLCRPCIAERTAAGAYAGMDRDDCRKRLWVRRPRVCKALLEVCSLVRLFTHLQQDMKAAGLVLKEEPHTLRVPRSQRGGEVIEPLVSEQWFVKMESLAAPGEPRCVRVR